MVPRLSTAPVVARNSPEWTCAQRTARMSLLM